MKYTKNIRVASFAGKMVENLLHKDGKYEFLEVYQAKKKIEIT